MATFTHIFAESDKGKILRNGIKISKFRYRENNGVFVSPVIDNYFYTHQWYRELKRIENVPKLAARIRIPDKELVLVGKYNGKHITVSASEAVRIVKEHNDPGGLEVIIGRNIKPKEILKIYKPNKVVGWRYYPKSHGAMPCGCPYCQRGEPNSRKLRLRYAKDY